MQSPTAPSSATIATIGTRGSPLALAQAHEVRGRLAAAHAVEPDSFAIQVIKTSGDAIQDRPLYEAGGKGLFTKEIEQALLAGDDRSRRALRQGRADLPAGRPVAVVVAAARGSARRVHQPQGQDAGRTCQRARPSVPRRRAAARWSLKLRPDLNLVSIRGNVETRLRKLESR